MQSATFPVSILVDLAALAAIVLCTARGYRRGLSGELAQVIGLLVGLVLGLVAFEWSQDWLVREPAMADRPGNARFAAIAIAMVATLAGILLVRWLLRRVLSSTIPEGPDHAGGAVAGFLRGATWVSMAFLLANLVPIPEVNRIFGQESYVGRPIVRLLVLIEDALPDEVHAVRDQLRGVQPPDSDPAGKPPDEPPSANAPPSSPTRPSR
jgi:uncharacterized membrane protein required for colicin V production